MYVYRCIYIFICTYICIYIYIHIHIYIYVRIYVYIDVHSIRLKKREGKRKVEKAGGMSRIMFIHTYIRCIVHISYMYIHAYIYLYLPYQGP